MNMLFKKSFVMAGVFLLGLIPAGLSAEPGRLTLHGSVPPATFKLVAIGHLPATNILRLAIGLPLRNPDELNELLRQIYDPASTNYHKYLSPEEMTARFGPTEQAYQAVEQFAESNGLVIVAAHPNRLLLDVTGSVDRVERAFQVTLRTYRHPTEPRDFFAPDSEPSVPANLSVADVEGLSNFNQPRPLALPARPQ